MQIILIRHGRTNSNVGFKLDTAIPGADLNDEGRQQAESLVTRLAEYQIQAIYASVLVRTQQTAAPLAQALDVSVQILAGLREISAGDDEMSTDATNYFAAMMAWKSGNLSHRVPGGENAFEFLARYDDAIKQVVSAGVGCAAVFSHGAALRTWASARVNGFDAALGDGVLTNTGYFVIEQTDSGFELVKLAGFKPTSGYLVAGERV